MRLLALASLAALLGSTPLRGGEMPDWLVFQPGPVNGIEIATKDGNVAVNRPAGDTPSVVLLTHVRRDIVSSIVSPIEIVAPRSSMPFLDDPDTLWENWWTGRFDYYGQQVTQWPVRKPAATRYLGENETEIAIGDLEIEVLPTPGYTIDGTTYLVEIDGVKAAFTGDLILAGGKVRDLYSFQNEIPEAKIGNYHGYLGRIAQWIASLEALAAEQPDLIVSSRGEIIHDPAATVEKGIATARAIYRNYLETNALHWYFGEERMNTCAEQVLGPDHGVSGMPFAEHVDLPDWCQHIGTTKLLVSESGRGFALDVGGKKSLETLQRVVADGLVTGIDGIFATHTHNDHTAAIAEAAAAFDCPVYSVPEVAGPARTPGDWFLPGLSANAVPQIQDKADGETMRWEEFQLTFRFFPGQMWNHGALLVEKPGHEPVFFIGDSFSPSGLDDYCLMNRNLLGDDTGYHLCFRIVESLPEGTWLVNQHIPHLFRFDEDEWGVLKTKYAERRELIAGFTPWDDPDYAVDPQWARFHPYGQELGGPGTVELLIENHSSKKQEFVVSIEGREDEIVQVEARATGSLVIPVEPPAEAGKVKVVTATIRRGDGVVVESFCEALVKRAE